MTKTLISTAALLALAAWAFHALTTDSDWWCRVPSHYG